MPADSDPVLRRELGLRDLTLFTIASIVSVRWIPAAAHAGPGSLTLWVLATLFYAVPLAFTVAALIGKYPGFGGFYLWTRRDFGPWHGFLCVWVYWFGIAFWFPGAAMFYVSAGLYSLGAPWDRLAADPFVVTICSLLVISVAVATNLVGLRIGKWTENTGAVATWFLSVLLIGLGIAAFLRRGAATSIDPQPVWNWSTLAFSATIAYGMSGLELVSTMSGEIRNPQRDLPIAGWLASGFTAAVYIAATLALLVLLPGAEISELFGFAQAGRAGATVSGWHFIAPLTGVLVLLSAVGQFGSVASALSRLPLAAGVDHLLPEAFSRIHPRWGTPHISMLTLGLISSALLIAAEAGDTLRAGYQTLVSLTLIGGFLPYYYIFSSGWRAGRKVSAILGLTVTTVAILCSIVPTEEIHSIFLFEAKLAVGMAAMVGSAWLVYRRMTRKIRSLAVAAQ